MSKHRISKKNNSNKKVNQIIQISNANYTFRIHMKVQKKKLTFNILCQKHLKLIIVNLSTLRVFTIISFILKYIEMKKKLVIPVNKNGI